MRPRAFGASCEGFGAIDAVRVFGRRGEQRFEVLWCGVQARGEAAGVTQRVVEGADERFIAFGERPGVVEVACGVCAWVVCRRGRRRSEKQRKLTRQSSGLSG